MVRSPFKKCIHSTDAHTVYTRLSPFELAVMAHVQNNNYYVDLFWQSKLQDAPIITKQRVSYSI